MDRMIAPIDQEKLVCLRQLDMDPQLNENLSPPAAPSEAAESTAEAREDCKERPFFLFEKRHEPLPAPLIGVTCGLDSDEQSIYVFRNYTQSILDAGGVPLLISLDTPADKLRDCIARLDGLLAIGGPDVEPARYGEEPHPQLGSVCPPRDVVEIEAIRLCREMGKPVLGVCRGVQVMAVALGGSLYQDLPSQVPSDVDHYPCKTGWGIREAHNVTVVCGTRLEAIAGGTYSVNSYHHQAVKTIPEGMRVCAHAPDGVIEAFEACEGPLFLGVQWHPERLCPEDPNAAALFTALIQSARAQH